MPSPLTISEADRLQALHELEILGSGPTPAFDRLCQIAQSIFGAPVALITLLDEERQWFKATCGIDIEATPRDVAFCNYTILSDDVLIVPDAEADQRFASNPLVTGEPFIRFYAGAPLILAPGIRLGSICIIDHVPRQFSSDQATILKQLAEGVVAELLRHREELDIAAERETRRAAILKHAAEQRELLRQKQARARTELAAGAGSWELNLSTGQLAWSDGLYRLLGYEPNEMAPLQEHFMRHVHWDDRLLTKAAQEGLQCGEALSLEFRIVRKDGEIRWLSSRAERLSDAADTSPRMVGVLSDITDAKAAEQSLRESEERYRALVAVSAACVWRANGTGAFIEGDSLNSFTGLSWAARDDRWLDPIHPEDRREALDAWQDALARRSRYDVKYRLWHFSGIYRWVEDKAIPVRRPDGSIREWVGMIVDIDERHRFQTALQQSEEFSRSILDSSPDCIKVLSLDGRLEFMSEAGARLMDVCDVSSQLGKEWTRLFSPEQQTALQRELEKARQGGIGRFVGCAPTVSGTMKWWENIFSPIRDTAGQPARLLTISRDITEAKLAQDEVEAARARLAAVLESTTDCVLVVDRDWQVTYLNEQASNLIGHERKIDVGSNWWAAYPELIGSMFHHQFERAFEQQAPAEFEAFLLSAGIWLEVHACPIGDSLSIFFRDITEARRAREEIKRLAHYDELTGLPNRARFNQLLEEAFSRGNDVEVGILVLDLDGFKDVNDTFGHPVGDALLKSAASRLQEVACEAGILARLGGDEFSLIMVQPTSHSGPQQVASRLVASMREPFQIDGNSIRLGLSIGLAVRTRQAQSAEDVFKKADIALYKAKAEGGTYRAYEPGMQEQLLERQALKSDLATALERGELHLVYQPVIELGHNRVSGCEALLRWTHPTKGPVSPADFIPLAEEAGFVATLGDWVMEEACRQATTWPHDVVVAVNVSPVQLRSRTLPLKVAQVLATTGLEAHRLVLEITESVLLNNSEANLELLHALKQLGVRIALDDFGTGYSSLGYLRNFPFDKIKIDRSFVSDIGVGNHSEAIIRAVINLGCSLDMKITAEGVETDDQLEWLRREGCHEAQGYLLSRPMAGDNLRLGTRTTATWALG